MSSSPISRGPDKPVGYLNDQLKACRGNSGERSPSPKPSPPSGAGQASRERSFSKAANYGRMDTPDLLPLES
ncbi:MAG: hypothetical protein H8E82_04650 [Candidatus Marinimicrobia bacterium]|nr:hypothetical protein [Candidatus Neomarinimicrobiota bacterium]